MTDKLLNYITKEQIEYISNYWLTMSKLLLQIENFDFSEIVYRDLSDDEEEYNEIQLNNYKIHQRYEKIQDKISKLNIQYEKYIEKLGLKFSDSTQDEILFNFINDGIIID